MADSNVRDQLDEKHERDRERRIEAVKRWVEYIKSEPPKSGVHSRMQSSTGSSMPPGA